MPNVQIGDLSDAIMQEMTAYVNAKTDDVKNAVRAASKTVQSEIRANAPTRSGKYARSWTTTFEETPTGLVATVHSKNRYQVAHLLEHGHAKRNGGRVPGSPHIAPAEQKGAEQLEKEIEKVMSSV